MATMRFSEARRGPASQGVSLIPTYLLRSVMMFYGVAFVLFDNEAGLPALHAAVASLAITYVWVGLSVGQLAIRMNSVLWATWLFTVLAAASALWSPVPELGHERAITIILTVLNGTLIYNVLVQYGCARYLLVGLGLGLAVNLWLLLFAPGGEGLLEGVRFEGTTTKSNILANIAIWTCLLASIAIVAGEARGRVWRVLLLFCVVVSLLAAPATGSKRILLLVLVICSFALVGWGQGRRLLVAGGICAAGVGLWWLVAQESSLIQWERVLERLEVFLRGALVGEFVDSSSQGRLTLAALAVEMIGERPFFGHGLGAFTGVYGTYSHNNYLELGVSVGLVGVCFYYAAHSLLLRRVQFCEDRRMRWMLYSGFLCLLLLDVVSVAFTDRTLTMLRFVFIAFVIQSAGSPTLLAKPSPRIRYPRVPLRTS